MNSQQRVDLTIRAALLVKEASGLINCTNGFILKEIIKIVEIQLKELRDKCSEYEKTKTP